ncbi:MAG: type II toxin-antitoxin system death-on-curing family toxin [Terracidiphilus sp.]
MSERTWRWVDEGAVYAIHDEQIAEHGGLAGVRDKALLLSALARPQHREAYGNPDLAELAAAYAVGIARNHPFLDGNKRTAIVIAAGVFLPLNGYELVADNFEIVRVMLAVADGTMPEPELAAWFRTYMRAL